MVATPEKFRDLFASVKSDDLDEQAIKTLVAAYEEDEGLETVPIRPLRNLLKLLKEKGFSFTEDSSLAPSYVLKQWCTPPLGEAEGGPAEKGPKDVPEEGSGSDSSRDLAEKRRKKQKSKKRKAKRSPSRPSNSKGKRSKRHGSSSSNILESLREAAGNTSADSGSDSDLSSFTKERRKKRSPPHPSSSSSSDSDSSSRSSSESSDAKEKPQEGTLRAVPKRLRQMKLLCDKKESKNLFGGFIARAMNMWPRSSSVPCGTREKPKSWAERSTS